MSSPRDVAAARAAFDQAMAAHRAGDVDGAERAYRKALRAEPAFAEAHYNLAHLMQAAGRIEEAVAGYRRALALRPRMAVAHNNLANALRLQGRADEALATTRRRCASTRSSPTRSPTSGPCCASWGARSRPSHRSSARWRCGPMRGRRK